MLAVEEKTVDEVQVAGVLAEWNPLGSRADSVPDLDGYRIEAIDIVMALRVFRGSVMPETNRVQDQQGQVLTFDYLAYWHLQGDCELFLNISR